MFKRIFRINLILIFTITIAISSGSAIINSVEASSIPRDLYPYDLIAYTRHRKLIPVRSYRHCDYRTRMSRGYIKAVIANEYRAINFYRTHEERNTRPLRKNYVLSELADKRAYQASRHFTHYDRGRVIAWQDAKRMHLGSQDWARRNLGENMCLVGKLDHVRENYRDAYYYFGKPAALADCNAFDLVNNDAVAHYAHGMNIMSGHNHYVGVGSYYNYAARKLYILSEFSVHRPVIKTIRK